MDLSTPLSEIQSFLAARFESRFDLHPRLFEETAASVLVPEGFRARVTAYRKDGGIDAVFDGPGERIIGVQVKRYKANIGVELIREFTGALVVNGLTEGVFVTTSGFTADARRAAVIVGKRGYRVELVDPKRFLEALEIAQRPRYQDKEDLLSTIGDPPLHHIQETRVPRPAQP